MNSLKGVKKRLKEIQAGVLKNLAEYGFYNNTGFIIRQIDKDTIFVVGLNHAVYAADDAITINPVMSISNIRVRKLLEILMEWEHRNFPSSVVSRPLGYLMPESNYKDWEFSISADSIEDPLNDMIYNIINYGIPWMEKQTDWRILLEVSKKYGLIGYTDYIPPVILLEYGEKQKAVEYGEMIIKEKLEKKRTSTLKFGEKEINVDITAEPKQVQAYKDFIERIRNWIS